MRARGLIVATVIAGLVYVYAEYSLRPRLAGLAGAFALGALAAYSYLTGRPRAVTAVAGALTVAVLLPVFWYERPRVISWMSYAPISQRGMPDDVRAEMASMVEAALERLRWMGLMILVAAVLLAVAVNRWQTNREQRSRRIMLATAAVAVLMVGVELYTIWGIADGQLGSVLVWAGPALVAAIVFLGAAAYAGEAVGAVGGTLLGMWTLALADTTARQAPALGIYSDEHGVFLEPGLQYGAAAEWSPTDAWAAGYGIILLLGIGLLAVVGPLQQRAADRVAG